MRDIQDRTLWMIEHNLVPTGVHLECAREIFKKARAFDIIKYILTTPCNDGIISLEKSSGERFYYIQARRKFNTQPIYITKEEYNLLKEVLNDENDL